MIVIQASESTVFKAPFYFFILVFLGILLCGISPHLVRSGDISLFVCIREPRVCDVVSIGRERTLGMSVCVHGVRRPFILTRLVCFQLTNHFDLFSRFDQFTR